MADHLTDTQPEQKLTPRAPRRWWRWGCLGLLVVGLLALGLAGYVGWRAWPHARAVYAALQDLRALRWEVAGWPTPEQVARAHADVVALDDNVGALVEMVRPAYPLLRRAGWVPRVGGTLAALPDLVDAGQLGLHAGRLMLDVFVPVFPEQRPAHPLDALPPVLQRAREMDDVLAEAEQTLDRMAVLLARVDPDTLYPPLDRAVRLAQEYAPVGGSGVALLRVADVLLGVRQERTWLVLALNNEELRPTGGFISAAGVVRVRDGQVLEMNLEDSYNFVSAERTYPVAPEDLRRFGKGGIFLLRDANWWPDGPTSAHMVARFYQLERGEQVDGVISVNLEGVRLLVDGLGGVRVQGYDGVVNGETLLPFFYWAWNTSLAGEGEELSFAEWWVGRKNFMRVLAAAMLERALGNPGSIPVHRLARRVVQALDERHLIINVFADPHAAAIIARRGWDAAVLPGNGDYLRVTDTNLGFNKANAKVRLAAAYTVDLRQLPLQATLTLTYTHTAQRATGPCIQKPYYGERYEDMHDRCYWDYVRIFRPRGTTVRSLVGIPEETVNVAAGDRGTLAVSGFMALRPGETRVVTLVDSPPAQVLDDGVYSLRVQKQPGVLSVPFVLRVQTPSEPVTTAFELRTDMLITVDVNAARLEVRPLYPLAGQGAAGE